MHIRINQVGHPNRGPNGLVVGHPLADVLRHERYHLFRHVGVVGVDAEDLRAPLATRVAEVLVDTSKGLGDFLLEVAGERPPVLEIPATCVVI